MLKRYQGLDESLFRLVDVIVVVGAWLISYWVRFELSPILPLGPDDEMPSFGTYASLSPVVTTLWFLVFGAMRVYDTSRMARFGAEIQLVLKAHGLALLYFIALTYMFEHYKYSRLVMIYFTVIAGAAMIACHFAVRVSLRRLRAHGFNLKHVLIAGDGPTAEILIARMGQYPELGLRVSGVVTHEDCSADAVHTKPVIGHFRDIVPIIRSHRVDEVLIALPYWQQPETDRLLTLLKDETVGICLIPDVQSHVTLGCETADFGGLPLIRLNDSPLFGLGALAKRVTDMVLSAIALLLLSPVLLLIGLLIKLSSSGPALYSQERMGLNGKTFSMLKFRSMRVDAEGTSGAVWSHAHDKRRTLIGSLLRKTSLDELPQLWNVLVGDMSLVGPRPERPVFVSKFRSEIPRYMLRHKVKAGMTGWAQINGWRGNTSLDRRIECDLFYIRNWSYALDLKILTMTLWRGFIHRNAY
jgi:Undecaprenyl-phosphate glucose phosphotransferase